MSTATDGSKVKVHYTGTLDDGSVFDSSRERDPLEFTIGEGMVIPGFENGIKGMAVGDTKTVDIPAAEAYGERNDEYLLKVGRDQLPAHIKAEVGMTLQVQGEAGQQALVTVTEMNDETVTLDGNHPLAGKDLSFEIELVSMD